MEEALRVKKEMHAVIRGSRQTNAETIPQNVPRVFSRQNARFEVLNSLSLNGKYKLIITKYILSFTLKITHTFMLQI